MSDMTSPYHFDLGSSWVAVSQTFLICNFFVVAQGPPLAKTSTAITPVSTRFSAISQMRRLARLMRRGVGSASSPGGLPSSALLKIGPQFIPPIRRQLRAIHFGLSSGLVGSPPNWAWKVLA